MLPLKKIICPTDFSEPSLEGLKAANELADHFAAEVILLHALSPMPALAGAGAPSGGFHIPAMLKEMEETAAAKIEHIKIEKVNKNVNVRTMVIHGKAADEIVRMAEDEKADLIVIATHGESGWEKFLFGSVTEKVFRKAACPVLVVPAPPEG